MSMLIDLSISLTRRPNNAPPNELATIAIHCAEHGLFHTGDVLIDPLTDQERSDLHWYLEEYWQWPFEGFALRGRAVETLLPQLGRRLFDAVFGSLQARDIVQTWRFQVAQPGFQGQISILSDIPAVLSLPWELLHDEHGFLVLRPRQPIAILRRLPLSQFSTLLTPFTPPLHVLLITARPTEAGFVDPRAIARPLLDALQTQIAAGSVALEFLRPPTLAALHARLSNPKLSPIHIVHFDGHGAFVEEDEPLQLQFLLDDRRLQGGGRGKLAFESAEGKLDLVDAGDLAQLLQDSGVQLAILTACQSAMGATDNVFSSVATRLIQGGVSAVVAMSASVLVASATRYVEAFYRALAASNSVPVAQERARQALHIDPRRHVYQPGPDREGEQIELRDWWLPHFYQQRPLMLQPQKKPRKPRAVPERVLSKLPMAPRYGFSGRSHELLQIERYLLHNKLVVIHGFGGVGKTALAREAADWLTRTDMFAGACFVSFEHGGDGAALLRALGHHLGVFDSSYDPNDIGGALRRLQPELRKQPTLVVIDNVDSLLPGGNATLDPEDRLQLWDIVLDLAQQGAGVLLTTRDTFFGDGRLTPGRCVAHVPLKGLRPDDAYTLAIRLLDDLQIDRKRVPYGELRDLLAQLDYHPLAIQLVLPALRDLSIKTLMIEFASLLHQFTDDAESDRNRSLSASLAYSLRRLRPHQRPLLARLAPFEGGASEDALLTVTELHEGDWSELRQGLEQTALLTAERTDRSGRRPFLRFHPVLTPFLRSQPGADDATLRRRYISYYLRLAQRLHKADSNDPQFARALAQQELPNLRRVLDSLIELGNQQDASTLEQYTSYFLMCWGRFRERDKLSERVYHTFSEQGALTHVEYYRERGEGTAAFERGYFSTAAAYFSRLLMRIEALPRGTSLGQGSYEHCEVLIALARCLRDLGQPAAESRLREALALLDDLTTQQPDNSENLPLRGILFTDLGTVLARQGKYLSAETAYLEGQRIADQLGDLQLQDVIFTHLGDLARERDDFDRAESYYMQALAVDRALGEPTKEGVTWHQLGKLAQEQEKWAKAERCYRKSLEIWDQLGNKVNAAGCCDQLGVIAKRTVRPIEAEEWYRRAIALATEADSYMELAWGLNNLASLLLNEVSNMRAPVERLVEARACAERSLKMKEELGLESEPWIPLHNLKFIAAIEDREDEARAYHRRECETFAAFGGNRWLIDHNFGDLIADIAAGARGDEQARASVRYRSSQILSIGGPVFLSTIQRIWAGERDWHVLAEELDHTAALLILRVLELLTNLDSGSAALIT